MTNSTATHTDLTGSQYLNIALGSLLIISEVLPYLKKHKGNGIVDTIVCLLKGSSCFAQKLAETIEGQQENNV